MVGGRERADGAWLVTGAASGLGAELVHRLLARGGRVVAWDRDALGLERLRQRHGGAELREPPEPIGDEALLTDEVDVTDADAVDRGMRRATRAGPIGHVFHSAGILRVGRVEETGADVHRELMDVNYLGTVHVSRAALAPLRASGSPSHPATLTLVASVAGLRGLPELAAYSASKHAVVGFATALADELDGEPIEVRVLCPPPADTPMVRKLTRVPPVFSLSRWFGADEVVEAALAALDRGQRGLLVLVDARSKALLGAHRMLPGAIDAWVRRTVKRSTNRPEQG